MTDLMGQREPVPVGEFLVRVQRVVNVNTLPVNRKEALDIVLASQVLGRNDV